MSRSITIHTLVENTVNIAGLRAEHGLAFLIRDGSTKVLFDTGQSDLLIENADRMGLALNDMDSIVLSHGHFDHTGGLSAVAQLAARATLFLHPDAVMPKYSKRGDGSSSEIGMRAPALATVRSMEMGKRVTWLKKAPVQISPGLWATGEVPRRNSFEDTGGPFFLDEKCSHPDLLMDDQAIFFESRGGTVVVLGCAHAGVVNTLDYVTELTNGRPIRALLGGMHLLSAGPERLHATIESLRKHNIQKLYPLHCTGIQAVAAIWAAFPGRCSSCFAGNNVSFELP